MTLQDMEHPCLVGQHPETDDPPGFVFMKLVVTVRPLPVYDWAMTLRDRLKKYGPYFQPPNAPLFVWAIANLISLATPRSDVGKGAGILALIALTVWALLELFRGAGPFRRALGAAVLAALAFEVLVMTDVIG